MIPTPGDRHVNRPLTDMSIAHFQTADAFVSARETPVVRSRERSNDYFLFDKGDLHRLEAEERAPGTRAARGGYRLTTTTFRTVRYSIAHPIYDEDLNNYDQPLDPEADGLQYINNQMLILREKKWADVSFVTGAWDEDLDGVSGSPTTSTEFTKWDEAGSTPIEDLRLKKTKILKNTGFEPNVAYIGKEVWDVLVDHPEVIDRMQASGVTTGTRTPMNQTMFAQLLGLEAIVVGKAVRNTAAEEATDSHSFILGAHVLLAYQNRANRARVKQPSATYTFAWTGFFGAEEEGFRIKRYREESESSDIIEGDTAFVHKVVGADMAAFFENAVSAVA